MEPFKPDRIQLQLARGDVSRKLRAKRISIFLPVRYLVYTRILTPPKICTVYMNGHLLIQTFKNI